MMAKAKELHLFLLLVAQAATTAYASTGRLIYSATVDGDATSYHLGGRDVVSGAEATFLEPGNSYEIRITAFNDLGASELSDAVRVGPLHDRAPDAPALLDVLALSDDALRVDFETPSLDGGSAIDRYRVEYDTSPTFDNNPRTVTAPVVREKQMVVVESPNVQPEVQAIRATVEVVNEVQSVRSTVVGVDEVQVVTTTADDVVAEVQTITTTAVDTDEEQIVAIMADDVDEIQLVRTYGDDVPEIQEVMASVERVNEIQRLGIVISNINTDGDNVNSAACHGVNVGEPCQDVEEALSGSFTVSFDFDECGNGGANYCQEAVSHFVPSAGIISCTPGLVSNPTTGGDHCVSAPVIPGGTAASFSASEGDAGTLQKAINEMIDDNGMSFMTFGSALGMPGKQTAVTVTRTGRIKTKGSCSLDSSGDGGGGPATCSGEYEILYEIEFDAHHSSGDVPPLTIVNSGVKIDTTSTSYTTTMCPSAYYTEGCVTPTGSAADLNHGNFYENSASDTAMESVKGSQPSGMVTLDYECESSVTRLDNGFTMSTSASGTEATFDDNSFTDGMVEGQYVRFNSGNGLDLYRKIVAIDDVADQITLETSAPPSTDYTDVEYGTYHSDWDESDGNSGPPGVSSHCLASRIHTTLPIDVGTKLASISQTDWEGKIGGLSVMDSTGIVVSRSLVPDLSARIGFVWRIVFEKQPGSVHEMLCSTVSGDVACSVSTVQQSSMIGGTFALSTTWPHEYEVEVPGLHTSSSLASNVDATTLKEELESITDGGIDNNRVFGTVNVVRDPYVPSSQQRWSGGYTWTITFASRGGNIPALGTDGGVNLVGSNVQLEVSDEDSGDADTYQGTLNSASFSMDDPGTARDGNQVSGSFALSWDGNLRHPAISPSANIFSVQSGGSGANQFMALSASDMQSLLMQHIFGGATDQIHVVRSPTPTQWMSYAYTVVFRHQDVGGDVAPLTYVPSASSLIGQGAAATVTESVRGTSIRGTFQLRFNGETTRPINHDASAEDMEDALNQLTSIAPSAVVVSRTSEPIMTGPADGTSGSSTQVGGYVWTVTFASNVWKDPTEPHDLSDVPGNWFGPSIAAAATLGDVWESSGFPKAWGKNVGDVPMMECIDSGLFTTNSEFPSNGCAVTELVRGTDPIGGGFKLCLDSTGANSNGVMSVETDVCTDVIAHNAPASAVDSGGDGSSVEEKLEQLDNVGDVTVTRSAVNARNGGYSWTIEFLRDADGPCQQKDDLSESCNAPGNVPKLCSAHDDDGGSSSSSSGCDVSGLSGSCERPGDCSKLVVLDATDHANSARPMGSAERQLIRLKDSNYLGWADGSVVAISDTVAEYKLSVNGIETSCIQHNAEAVDVAAKIQAALDADTSGNGGGLVKVEKIRSEVDAPNGFLYHVDIYDAGNVPPITASFAPGTCGTNDFSVGQQVVVEDVSDGALHSTTCSDCVDGVVQRGDFTTFGDGESGVATLPWDASPEEIASHILATSGRSVDVTRKVLDKYGAVEWELTFVGNPGETPPGAGDVPLLRAVQAADTGGTPNVPIVNEIQKGSSGLSGSFLMDYFSSSGPRQIAYDESASRFAAKLSEMSTIGTVHVTRDCFPDCSSGGWGNVPVSGATATRGGLEWKIYFLDNPGIYNGFTFPPGSGSIDSPSIDTGALGGTSVLVESANVAEGSLPLTGTFHLEIDGEQTVPIPYAADSITIEQSLFDLSNTGRISVQTRDAATKAIPNVLVSVDQDASILRLESGSDDLRTHLAPGDRFRVGGGSGSGSGGVGVGGSGEPDGAVEIGSAQLTANSPIAHVSTSSSSSQPNVGEHVRVRGDVYGIVRNSIEVQSIAVARAQDLLVATDDYFYQIEATIGDSTETTSSCLKFDASAVDVQQALEGLSSFQEGDVIVSRSDSTTGSLGDAHLYRIYFVGDSLLALGDLPEIVVAACPLGLPAGVDATNSHATANTIVDGGGVEHQRITLAADSGITATVPAYQITIYDDDFSSSVTSPCIEWGASSLDLASVLDGAFSRPVFTVGAGGIAAFDDGNGTPNLYRVEASSFVQGSILMGDRVSVGDSCRGQVIGFVKGYGKAFDMQAPQGCSAAIGEVIAVEKDASIIESIGSSSSSSSSSSPSTEISELIMYSDSEVVASDGGDAGLFKLRLKHQGLEETTSCIQYGATAEEIQTELDGLFDYNLDGVIDQGDDGHIVVTRHGDGTMGSGFGFTYRLESKGSPDSGNGVSTVLGSGAPTIEIATGGLIGDDGGCSDAGGHETLVSTQATVVTGTDTVSSLDYLIGHIQPGGRIKIDASSSPTKTYTVQEVSEDGMTLTLDEPFVGTSATGTASISVLDGGVPHVDLSVLRPGVDEYVYDIYFTGSGWSDVPDMEVSVFGDGACEADVTHVQGGMNRNIAVSTMSNGGNGNGSESDSLTRRDVVLDRAIEPQDEVIETSVYLVPPIYTVHDDVFEVQQLIVKDTDNGAIWGGDAAIADSSFKLIYDGDEATECLSYHSTESQVEEALSALPGLCSFGEDDDDGNDDNSSCVTVTKTIDPVQAPNGFVFTIYFNGEATLSKEGDVPELIVDTAHSDCTPFTAAGGESAEVSTIRNGSTSMAFTAAQLPLGHVVDSRSEMSPSPSLGRGDSGRWFGNSAENLRLYRITGTLWTATFDDYLGDAPQMEISMGSLPPSAEARVFDDILTGVNPTSIALSPLTTGVTHYARVTATTEVGDSPSSSSDKAAPSDVPPPLADLFVDHALQVNEVQSITLAATHIPEVQRITTSASSMPEVQEVVLSSGSSAIDGGAFSLRIPEKETIHVLSSSPIEAGSYALTIEYVDTAASIALGGGSGGQIVTQTMMTACIPWSASAETVQKALETEGSTINPLGAGSVRVTRSGDASYSSSFGYSYEVEFVGTAYRGNVGALSSDTSPCEAFDSPTNDAVVQITTNNDSLAVGTDTPRAQLLIESSGGLDIIEGSYQLSVDYLGGVQTTDCIDWDASAQDIEAALESLDNVDSVRVDFVESEADDGTSGALASEPSQLQRRFTIYFDGNGMHTDGSSAYAGFDPSHNGNFAVILANGASSSCISFKTYKDNVLTDFDSIDGAEAAVTIESTYRGGSSTLSAVASDLTIQDVESSLLDAMPMHFHTILVARSLEDDESGVTYTLTFGEDNGNVAGLVCNGDENLTLLGTTTCTGQTVMDGNALSGYFFVDSSEPIQYDASAAQMEAAIEGINGIDDVSVTRSGPDGQEGYAWDITFLSDPSGVGVGGVGGGDVAELAVYSSLQGKDATVRVVEIVKGNEIGGTFTLSYMYGDSGGDGAAAAATTEPIPFDATADMIKDLIEKSSMGVHVGHMEITEDSLVDSEGGRSFQITFVDNSDATSTGGDRPLLQADSSQLSGVGAAVTVREEIKGSSARGDSLAVSYEMPYHSNGAPITGTAIEANLHEDFIGDTSEIQLPGDYSVQIVSIRNNDAVALSGSFRLSYDGKITDDIPVDASDLQIKMALEQLSSINTIGVVKGDGRWTITFHLVEGGIVKPLRSGGGGGDNKLYPSDASVQIRLPDCSKCLYISDLLLWKEYHIRARVMNARGSSVWRQTTGIAMTVPSAPTNTRLDVHSGECLEVFFSAPLDSGMVSSYLIQHDLVQEFPSPLGSISVSCDVPSCQQLICGLDAGTEYYARVAAVNEVQVQGNRQWSIPLAATPVDIAPNRPGGLAVSSLVRHGLQLIIDPPTRDGGREIETVMISWSPPEVVDQAGSIEISLSEVDTLPDGQYIVNIVDASLLPDQLYELSVQAKNSVGIGEPVISTPVAPSGPPDQPSNGVLTTLSQSPLPITEALVTWDEPSDTSSPSSPSITGYKVEWYCTTCKTPEVQLIKLQHSAPLTNTKFSLSYSPTPEIKKETAMLPWDAPADLVRRELINLGWSETDDPNLLQDVQVSRSTLTNGYAWHVTFGDHPDRDTNDGDIVALVGSVSANGDAGSPTITITTTQDGRRAAGQSEIQYLQVVGSGSTSSADDVGGFYRLKLGGSEYTPYISAHADASELELALEQLSSVGDVVVVQNDDVSEDATGTNDASSGANLIHHYEITFVSNVGNVDRLLVDDAHLTTRATPSSEEEAAPSPGQANVRVFDGDNSLNAFDVKDSAAVPGEMPGLYGSFDGLDASARSFTIPNLSPGKEYAVVVSARNAKHGYGPRMVTSPSSVMPPIQTPGKPTAVTLDVNNGYSDSVKMSFSPPSSDGGDGILRYRVEMDPSPSFDNPIVEEFTCPNNNKRTVWRVETTTTGGGVISGGSFTLNVQVNGYNYLTSNIPYDAPALKHNETGIVDELPAIFSTTSGSATVLTVPATDVETSIFTGDRLRFSGQSAPFKYYQVQSVATNIVTLTEPFVGADGLQEATSRHYGGRGDPSSSRIHCQVDASLCPEESEKRSGSMQSKLQDLTHAITAGVLVDRDGPSQSNTFVWRITFLDNALPPGSDYDISLATAALTTADDVGSASASARLLTRGESYEACHGTLTVPSLGGLVKGLAYHARVLAINSEGYSLPAIASEPQAPMVIPGPPTSVSLDVASDTELIVMFAPPSDNGGAGIIKYMVEWSPSSDFSNAESSSVEYLVGGAPFYKTIEELSSGINYYVRVSAVNEMGQGLWQSSTPPSLNPHRTPDPPRSIVLASTSETMVTVGWSPPMSDGGDPITKYRVEWDERDDFISYAMPPNKGYRDIDASNESFTIELLNKRKAYFVRVGAINSAGIGMSRIANPSNVIPANQVPGQPYAPTATPGSLAGSIHVSWLRPVVPHHSISCSGTDDEPLPCPTPYGSSLSAANGGSPIQEYEVELNLEDGFGGGSIRKTTSQLATTIDGLISGRIYYVRVLARNSVGSGAFSTVVAAEAT